MNNIYKLLYLFATVLLFSCSKESIEDSEIEEVEPTPVCELETPATSCSTVYLEGRQGEWMEITETGESLEPLFLYQEGETSDPYGTVTITIKTAVPEIRLNDTDMSEVRVVFSRDAEGKDSECFLIEDIPLPASEEDPDLTVRSNRNYVLPFYIQIEANVCE